MKKSWLIILMESIGIGIVGLKIKKHYDSLKTYKDKMESYYHLLNRWLKIYQNESSLIPFFIEKGYKKVAIYGYKELGERLYNELKKANIQVEYIIDRAADSIYSEVKICSPYDKLDMVDVVIVTAPFFYDEIESIISKQLDCPIISIEEVLFWVE